MNTTPLINPPKIPQISLKHIHPKSSPKKYPKYPQNIPNKSVKYSSNTSPHPNPQAQQELEALSKAQDIIGSGAVAGSAEKHLPGLVQTATSLAFLRSFSARPEQLEQATGAGGCHLESTQEMIWDDMG